MTAGGARPREPLRFEHRQHPPISHRRFLRRMAFHLAVAGALVAGSTLIGMGGYAYFEGLGWRDAFLNSTMLLGGMGPVETPQTPGGKLFAGFFALYSGLVFLVAAAIIFAPAVHRLLHLFHYTESKSE
jgi:hypothetical protein